MNSVKLCLRRYLCLLCMKGYADDYIYDTPTNYNLPAVRVTAPYVVAAPPTVMLAETKNNPATQPMNLPVPADTSR